MANFEPKNDHILVSLDGRTQNPLNFISIYLYLQRTASLSPSSSAELFVVLIAVVRAVVRSVNPVDPRTPFDLKLSPSFHEVTPDLSPTVVQLVPRGGVQGVQSADTPWAASRPLVTVIIHRAWAGPASAIVSELGQLLCRIVSRKSANICR